MNHLRPCFKFQPKFIPSPSNNNNNSFNNNNWKLRRTFFAVARSCKVDDKGLAATIEDSKHTQLIFFKECQKATKKQKQNVFFLFTGIER